MFAKLLTSTGKQAFVELHDISAIVEGESENTTSILSKGGHHIVVAESFDDFSKALFASLDEEFEVTSVETTPVGEKPSIVDGEEKKE